MPACNTGLFFTNEIQPLKLMWPYTFSETRTSFKALIPSPSASLCSNFVAVILRLPLMLFQIVRSWIDENGALTATFLSMIYTPGELKTTLVSMTGVQKGCWLLCDGSLYSVTQYPDLAAALGASASDGGMFKTQTNPNILDENGVPVVVTAPTAGLFRVPDLRGLTPIGVPSGSFSLGGTTPIGLGSTIGEAFHRLIPGEDVPHTHNLLGGGAGNSGMPVPSVTDSVANNGGVGAAVNGYQLVSSPSLPTLGESSVAGGDPLGSSADLGAIPFTYTLKDSTGAVITTQINYYAATAHNNIQPSMGVFYYIFAGVPVTANTDSTDDTLQPI